MQRREIAVVGGGLAGTATAIGLAKAGFDTVLIAPKASGDGRSTALIGRSVSFLSGLGIFDRLGDRAAPLSVMRLIDDTGRLMRAPTVEFRAGDLGLDMFGYNVVNSDLQQALDEEAEAADRLEICRASVTGFEADGHRLELSLDDGETYAVCLAVAADGRNSTMRRLAGIDTRKWDYPQTALVLNFSHGLEHRDVSTEFHTRAGPFTQVPLVGRRSSLVWVEEPKLADLYIDLKRERLSAIVEEKLHSILGKVEVEDPIQRFPLSSAVVERLTGERLALVGEAGHAFPPIGAQGLNLGIRDCETLVRLVSESRDDPGRRVTLRRYEAARRADVRSRTAGVDVLNRSLLAGFLPQQAARSVGLTAMSALPFLRNFAMREGLSPGAGLWGLSDTLRQGMSRERAGLQ